MTRKELYNICHDEAVTYANSEQHSKRTGEQKSFLIQGYLDAMMEMRKSEITEKKKEYPKTYEECEKVLRYDSHRLNNMGVTVQGYKWELIRAFQMLLICRDAYLKKAGEEMGLGKPWEPDFSSREEKFSISVFERKLVCIVNQYDNIILTFPTREMRDVFYDYFEELINECKEFL